MSHDRNDDAVVEAARAVRPYLAGLVGPAEARGLDERIVQALRGPAGPDADSESDLLTLFDSRAELRDWVAAFWEQRVPPEFMVHAERAAPPPGDGELLVVSPERFACPVDGNYVRFMRAAFEDPGRCPEHDVPLARPGAATP